MTLLRFAQLSLLLLSLSAPVEANRSRLHHLYGFIPDSSSRILDVASDSRGVIWVASPDGLLRFDGRHYHRVTDFPLATSSFVAVAPDRSIWAGGNAGLAVLRSGKWSLLDRTPVSNSAKSPLGLWIVRNSLEFLPWQGAAKAFPAFRPSTDMVWTSNKLWFPDNRNLCSVSLEQSLCQPLLPPGDWLRAFPDKSGTIWFSSLTSVGNSQALSAVGPFQRFMRPFLDPLVSPSGQPWFIRDNLPAGFPTWPSNPVSDGCAEFLSEDSRLVCANQQLIARFDRNPDWEFWDSKAIVTPVGFLPDLPNPPLVLSRRGLFKLDTNSRSWQPMLPGISNDVRAAVRLDPNSFLLATLEEGLLHVSSSGDILGRYHPCSSIDTYRVLRKDSQSRIWVGGKDPNCFFLLDSSSSKLRFLPQKLPGQTLQTVAIEMAPDDTPWVGDEFGLAYLTPAGSWERIRTDLPLTHIRTFSFASKDTIWISHRRPGFFTRIDNTGSIWKVTRFSSDKYPPANVHSLRVDSRGWLWRATNQGFYISRPGQLNPEDSLLLDASSGAGLGSASINGFWEDPASNLWLAGDEGIVRLKPVQNWFSAPPGLSPRITRIQADNQSWFDLDALPTEFPAATSSLTFDFSTLGASPFRPNPLRYRLNNDPNWHVAPNASLKLVSPAEGTHVLDIAFAGAAPANYRRYSFVVGQPLLHSLAPFLAIFLVGSIALLTWLKRDLCAYWFAKSKFLLALRHSSNSDPLPLVEGEILNNRYRIKSVLARGGFSFTYLATEIHTPDARLVIKILHNSFRGSHGQRNRFTQEVNALTSLSHPGLVPLIDWWINPSGEPCLAMAFVEGPTLRAAIDAGPLPPGQVARLATQLADTLVAIHARGIIHRDLKPENVILAADHPRIIDFGISALRGRLGESEDTVTISGSLHYLAPERLLKQYSTASDIYSLAVILLESLTAKRPAQFQSLPSEPGFALETSPWISNSAAAILAEGLNHNPGRRPSDLSAWATRLSLALQAEPPATSSQTDNPT